ncbi:MAG: nicotinic acid mononucleotide adenylyltransferase, partial [Alphaproteobacteria bacterium CG11_big_fil_rev_8_21_14_0_20_44_7]
MKIGLLGGSFNPAHAGHLYISEVAIRQLGLQQLWWLVSPQNPLKSTTDMMSFEKRFESAQKIARHPKIIVSDIERRLGTQYTADTLSALRRRFRGDKFVWIMGA